MYDYHIELLDHLYFLPRNFPQKVWLMVLISLVSVSIYFATSSMLTIDRLDRYKKLLGFGDYVLYSIAILTNQGTPPYMARLCPFFLFLKFKKEAQYFVNTSTN